MHNVLQLDSVFNRLSLSRSHSPTQVLGSIILFDVYKVQTWKSCNTFDEQFSEIIRILYVTGSDKRVNFVHLPKLHIYKLVIYSSYGLELWYDTSHIILLHLQGILCHAYFRYGWGKCTFKNHRFYGSLLRTGGLPELLTLDL